MTVYDVSQKLFLNKRFHLLCAYSKYEGKLEYFSVFCIMSTLQDIRIFNLKIFGTLVMVNENMSIGNKTTN